MFFARDLNFSSYTMDRVITSVNTVTWTTHLLLVVVSLGGGEHQEVGLDLAREDLLGGLVVKINDQRQGLGADETGNILFSQLERKR